MFRTPSIIAQSPRWGTPIDGSTRMLGWVGYHFGQECVAVSINICPWQDPMQFGTKVPGTPCGTPGCRRDVSYVQQNQTFPPTHETAPLFLYKHVILATHSFSATKGRVFKQCATKGRVLNTKCVPERVWFFPAVVPQRAQNAKICTEVARGFAVPS